MKVLVFDVETTGLRPDCDKLHGVGYDLGGKTGYVRPEDLPAEVVQALASPKVLKVGQNIRFDIKFMLAAGFKVGGPIFCTKLAQVCLNENVRELGLDDLVEAHIGPGRLPAYAELTERLRRSGLAHVGQLCVEQIQTGSREDWDLVARYCLEDVANTKLLAEVLESKLQQLGAALPAGAKTPLDYLREEAFPTERLLADVELRGLEIDLDVVEAMKKEQLDRKSVLVRSLNEAFREEIDGVERGLVDKARAKLKTEKGRAAVLPGSASRKTRFLWTSPDHVATLLYRELGATAPSTTKSGRGSTDEATLLAVASSGGRAQELARGLLEVREAEKRLTTYIGDADAGLLSAVRSQPPARPRFYPEYDNRVVTGRLGSFAHTFPRDWEITRCFKPDPGHVFLYFDYSQIELRIAAHLSGDPVMVEAFRLGLDIHRKTAAAAFGVSEDAVTDTQRQAAKSANFLMIYDGSWWMLQQTLLAKAGFRMSDQEARRFIDGYFKTYHEYRRYLDRERRMAEQRGWVLSEAGRLRRLPDLSLGAFLHWKTRRFLGPVNMIGGLKGEEAFEAARKRYAHAKKQAYNHPIQSLGATITKRACLKIASEFGLQLAYTQHDSAVFQIRADQAHLAPQIKAAAEAAYPLKVPVVCDMKLLNSLCQKDVFFGQREAQSA